MLNSEKLLMMEIVYSELSEDAWFDKKSAEALIQVRKVQQGEFIEDKLKFRKKCGEMRQKNKLHRVFLTSSCGECCELFFSPRSRWRFIIFSPLSLKRWTIFFSPLDAVKKIINRIRQWKRLIHRHREQGEKK